MKNYDIVYFLKDTYYNEELRYSLRSVEENFPHARVIFAGGCPVGFKPDLHIEIEQSRFERKNTNVKNNVRIVCENNDLTDDIFIFNDDFFILKHIESWESNCYNGTIAKLRENVLNNNKGCVSHYIRLLKKSEEILKQKGYTTKNFELHCPMLINRKKMLTILDKFNSAQRSLYGNVYFKEESGHLCKDRKIVNLSDDIRPSDWFVSTDDSAFKAGKIGNTLRNKFAERSRFEI